MLNFTKGVLVVFLLAISQGSVPALGNLSSKAPKVRKLNYTPILPQNLCSECVIDLTTISPQNGTFLQPLKIFTIQDKPEEGCLKKMGEYVALNQKDTVTAQAYAGYVQSKDRNGNAYKRLERVAYTFCELCCDCIDILSPKEVPKLDILRPNCGLHHVYDISTYRGLFPDMVYQNYTTGTSLYDPPRVMKGDMEIWLQCFQKVYRGRVKVRSAVGLAGYHDKRRKLRSTHTSPMSTVMDEEEMLANPELSNHSTRKMLQAGIDCSDTAAVDAAVKRVQADLQAVNDWIGCGSMNSYKNCHQMEYAQGRVCGSDTDSQCRGKNW